MPEPLRGMGGFLHDKRGATGYGAGMDYAWRLVELAAWGFGAGIGMGATMGCIFLVFGVIAAKVAELRERQLAHQQFQRLAKALDQAKQRGGFALLRKCRAAKEPRPF